MSYKYCLPIIQNIKEKVLQKIQENPEYGFYEIWLSYIEDLDADFIWNISDKYDGKLIILFRKQNLEKSSLDKEQKEKIIKLLETSENFLDLDINDQKEELEFIKKNKLSNQLIVSYHNYSKTPEMNELEKSIKEMEEYKPEIIKISCFCKTHEDSLKLLTLLLKLKEEKKKNIVLGMGEEGKIVRIYGALWGNEFNFAPIDEDEKSAPGQITKEKLERILEDLK